MNKINTTTKVSIGASFILFSLLLCLANLPLGGICIGIIMGVIMIKIKTALLPTQLQKQRVHIDVKSINSRED